MKFSGYLETTFRRGGVEVRHVAFSLYLCFFPVSAIYFCTGIVLMCMFFVLLFFTQPLLVGILSRVIKRQTAGPSTCRLEGGGLLTLSLSFAAFM